jgi:hypothetical protein
MDYIKLKETCKIVKILPINIILLGIGKRSPVLVFSEGAF